MKKTPLYLAFGLAASPAFAQGVDKSAANYKEGPISDYTTLIDQALSSSAAPELPEDLNKEELYKVLGLGSIKSYAQSSTPDGTEWINKIHLDNGGNHEGVFKLFTTSKHKGLSVADIAPAGADLAGQVNFNLATLEPMLKDIAKLSGAEDLAEVEEGMAEEVPQLGMTGSDLLKKLDLRLNFVLDLDEAQKIPTPFGELDKPNLTIRIDGLSWIWEKVGPMVIGGSGLPFAKTDEGETSTYSLPPEMAAQFMGYSPVLKVDKAGDFIWLSSTGDFLTKCSNGEDTLAQSDAFKATMEDLPSDGQIFGYASKSFYNFFDKTIGSLEEQGMLEGADEMTKNQLNTARKHMTKVEHGAAQILTTDDSGILWAERGVQTIEQQMLEAKKALDAQAKADAEEAAEEAAAPETGE
ncbi:hypothetical protein ACFPK9_01725 [Rubritalea spongiae]|uniref:Uncharacterized protein n=1 Tax=Rubritalea spongiae TaxID=430797 RepID=A0ABW5DZ11_9BACT